MNRWWADAEVFLHVGFGRRTAMQPRVQVDVGQILALLGGEEFSGATHAGHSIQLVVCASRRGGTDECTLSCHIDPIRAQRARSAFERGKEPGAKAQAGPNSAGCRRWRQR